MGAKKLIQSGHCSPGPGHQSQNGGVAASSLSLAALSAPVQSGLLYSRRHTGLSWKRGNTAALHVVTNVPFSQRQCLEFPTFHEFLTSILQLTTVV